ncbi:hypothetical protein IWX76_000984 [Pedobacter sp. CAN_A7]
MDKKPSLSALSSGVVQTVTQRNGLFIALYAKSTSAIYADLSPTFLQRWS